MITDLAATAANCSTGSWAQKWKCGWNEPTATAAHAGYFTGHDVLPALIVLAVVVFLVAGAVRRRRKAGARRAPSGSARARTGARW